MTRFGFAVFMAVTLGAATFVAQGQSPSANPFPLAAPAGKDSNAKSTPPPGAQNQGALDPANWKYGPAFNAPAGSKIWNPVKLKMMAGQKVTGGTVFGAPARRAEPSGTRSRQLKVRPPVQRTRRQQNLESRKAENDGRPESHRRHRVQRHRSRHL